MIVLDEKFPGMKGLGRRAEGQQAGNRGEDQAHALRRSVQSMRQQVPERQGQFFTHRSDEFVPRSSGRQAVGVADHVFFLRAGLLAGGLQMYALHGSFEFLQQGAVILSLASLRPHVLGHVTRGASELTQSKDLQHR